MVKKVYIVAGPTAGGKTGYALKLAKKTGGEILNADALQVYKDLRILTARPTVEEAATCPHHLYGLLDAYQTADVAWWLGQVVPLIKQIDVPILVGGTGMYLYALEHGLCTFPDIPEDVRKTVRSLSLEDVKRQVKDCRFSDPQRLKRALEVQLTTGRSIHQFQKENTKKYLTADFHKILILPDRDVLYDRCAKRLDIMLKTGAIEEVKNLLTLHPTGGVLKAIGVPEITQYLNGDLSLAQAKAQILLATRHYAKRQITWFKNKLEPQEILAP